MTPLNVATEGLLSGSTLGIATLGFIGGAAAIIKREVVRLYSIITRTFTGNSTLR